MIDIFLGTWWHASAYFWPNSKLGSYLVGQEQSLGRGIGLWGPIVFYDGFVTLYCASYQKDTKNILLQHVIIKGKHFTNKWGLETEIKNSNPSDVMEHHRETSEALFHTMDDQENENAMLKQRINELEISLSMYPLFAKPLSIVQSIEDSLSQSWKFDKISHLLLGVHSFVAENIKGKDDMISEAF